MSNLIGSAFSDTLTGNNLNNVIEGEPAWPPMFYEVIVWSLRLHQSSALRLLAREARIRELHDAFTMVT